MSGSYDIPAEKGRFALTVESGQLTDVVPLLPGTEPGAPTPLWVPTGGRGRMTVDLGLGEGGPQAAIELANSAVEQVRALKGSSLLTGRSQDKSIQQWQNAYDTGPAVMRSYLDVPGRAAGPDVNRRLTMRLAWDTHVTDPTLGDDAAIPTASQTMTVQATSPWPTSDPTGTAGLHRPPR